MVAKAIGVFYTTDFETAQYKFEYMHFINV